MARPCKERVVCLKLKTGYFKPSLHPLMTDDDIVLEVDEMEAVRLADFEREYQQAAAVKMAVSRATFSNIIKRAHQKIACALIEGKPIRINCPKLNRAQGIKVSKFVQRKDWGVNKQVNEKNDL